jgi:hypothetical protein
MEKFDAASQAMTLGAFMSSVPPLMNRVRVSYRGVKFSVPNYVNGILVARGLSELERKNVLTDYLLRAKAFPSKSDTPEKESFCIGALMLEDLGLRVSVLPVLSSKSLSSDYDVFSWGGMELSVPSLWFRTLVSLFGQRRAGIVLAEQCDYIRNTLRDKSFCLSQSRTYTPKKVSIERAIASRIIFLLMKESAKNTKIVL